MKQLGAKVKQKSSERVRWALLVVLLGIYCVVFFGVILIVRIYLPSALASVILFLVSIVLLWNTRSLKPLNSLFYLLAGCILGVTINGLLNIDFIAHPSIDFAVASAMANSIVFYRLFWRVRNIQNSLKFSKKLRFLFLGVSLASLFSAASIFVSGSLSYLPTYLTDAGQSQLGISPAILVGIFKSLFLSGLFSFFERLLNITQKT